MGLVKLFVIVVGLVFSQLCISSARAGVIIGPGDIVPSAQDGSTPLLVVDLNNPRTLSAGIYAADVFNYQYTTGLGSWPLGGGVRPVLFTGSGTNFQVIALGDLVPYAGATGFSSVAFGGSNQFTLASSQTVYGGIYWEAGFTGAHLPLSFLDNSGSTFLRYGAGTNSPIVGNAISGGSAGSFPRRYDFSISVENAAAVPEPASLLLLGGLGAYSALTVAKRRRRQNVVGNDGAVAV